MGLNTSLAEEVRKSTFGREMRKPIADGCEYTSTDEIADGAKNAVLFALEQAEEDLDSSLQSKKYSLQSIIISGRNNLKDAVDNSEKRLRSTLTTETILLKQSIKNGIEALKEELRDSNRGIKYLNTVLKDDLDAIEDIRQGANEALDIIDEKCDTRITDMKIVPISGSKEYVSMVFTTGGDGNG